MLLSVLQAPIRNLALAAKAVAEQKERTGRVSYLVPDSLKN